MIYSRYWVNGPISAGAAVGLQGQPQHTTIRATLEARSQRLIHYFTVYTIDC